MIIDWERKPRLKSLLTLACAVATLLLSSCSAFHREDIVSGPVQVTHHEDFTGDGRPDDFILEWSQVRDYSFDPETNRKSNEKYHWCQARLQVASSSGVILADDLFAFKADDFAESLGKFVNAPNLTPEQYFTHYFDQPPGDSPFRSFTRRWVRLKDSDIDRAMITELIKYHRSNATLDEIEAELLADRRLVFEYVRSDGEDRARIAYSRRLGRAVYLANPR